MASLLGGLQPDSSLPPSPSSSEDLTQSRILVDGNESHTPANKHKGKQREGIRNSTSSSDEELENSGSYPPKTEDTIETRRVEENLKRWEIAERQRRKAARDSTITSNRSSVVSDVGRLLWRNTSQRNSRPPPPDRSLGNHAALQSTDSLDTLPLRPVSSPPVTPTPTSSTFSVAGNPFSHPQDEAEAADEQTAVMIPATDPPPSLDSKDGFPLTSPTPDRPILVASSSSFSKPPPPKPLGLPPPKTPPRIQSPSESPVQSAHPQEQKEFRWWHDWLCGCGEGEDRGGDNQAGRTNPFE